MTIFNDCTFFLSQCTSKPNISKSIKDNGGTVSFMLTKNVTHFITNDKEFQQSPYNLKKAQGFGIHIVSEDFINESVLSSQRLDESNYGFKELPKPKQFSFFDSPAKSPVKTQSSSSSTTSKESPLPSILSTFKDDENSPKRAEKTQRKTTTNFVNNSTSNRSATTSYTLPLEESITVKSSFQPISSSNNPTIEIRKNPTKINTRLYSLTDKDQPEFSSSFDILLTKTLQFSNFSGSSSNNKFYHLELQKDILNKYRVYTSYGRSDGKRTNECRYGKDLNEAIDIFSMIYNEKTSDKKGYKEVELTSSSVSSTSTSGSFLLSSSSSVSSLPEKIAKLIEHLYSEATTQLSNSNTVKITERGLETPLGVLSLEQIEKGEKVLYRIKDTIESTNNTKTLETLSSEFYTCIPHSMGRGKTATNAVINNLNQVNSKFELLQLMKDLLVIKDSSSSYSGTSKSATDMKFHALKNKITVLSQYDLDYKEIQKMANETKGVAILNIYKLDREGDTSVVNLTPSPTKLLLHGSRPSNIVGILSRGMLLPKVVVDTGASSRTDFGFLGYGIYYGNSFETTCKYSHPSQTDGQQKRYCIVSRVALGKISNHTTINSKLNQPPKGFDSCLGIKNSPTTPSQFHDNEYVIYDSKKQRQEYLVEFTYNGSAIYNSTPIVSLPSTTPITSTATSDSSKQSRFYSIPKPSAAAAPPQPSLILPTKTPSSLISNFNNLSLNNNNNNNNQEEFIDEEENKYRKLFVSNRKSAELSNPFLHCKKIFEENQNDYSINNDIPFNKNLIMGVNMERKKFVSSQYQFNENWKTFSNSFFDGFNWDNCFVAGGSVLGCSIDCDDKSNYSKSDVDIFLYGLSVDEANRKLDSIEKFIKSKSPNSQMARTKYAVTFLNNSPFRNIQIVLRIYKSPAEVLMGFDIDCCSIGYDGKNVYALPRSIRSIKSGINNVSMSRRSLTYETRLFKYALRGFAINVPKFDRDLIPSEIYYNDIKTSNGLLKLLLLEHKYSTNKNGVNYLINNSDYNTIEIPSGPYWNVNSAVGFINYKEKSQFFAKKKDGFKHCHLVVVGENAKAGKADWCKKCKNGEIPQDSATQDVVTGEIKWLTENPGSQLLTGSFHPVDDNKWYDLPIPTKTISNYKQMIIQNQDVTGIPDFSPKYNGLVPKLSTDSNHLLCLAAAYGSHVSMRSMIGAYKQYINTSDEFGYYPIHYAVKSGSQECLSILFENNCSIPIRSLDFGISSGMVAQFYDRTKEYAQLYLKCPRIQKVKCRIYTHRTLTKWMLFSRAHQNPPPITIKSSDYEPKLEEIWDLILTGNTKSVQQLIYKPGFQEITDPLGNSLFHYAVLSPNPKIMIQTLKEKNLVPSKWNIFGQTPLHFAKALKGNIKSWLKVPSDYSQIPKQITLTPSYLIKEINEIIDDLSRDNIHGSTNCSSIPYEYILNYSKSHESKQQPPITIQSAILLNDAPPPSSIPSMPSFGFGGKFAPQPRATSTSQKTSNSIGSFSSFVAPSWEQYTPISSATPPTPSSPSPSSPSLSGFVVVPKDHPTGFPLINGGMPPNPYQLPQQFISKPISQIQIGLSLPKDVDINSSEFLSSSRVAQILSLIDQFTHQGILLESKSNQIKQLLFDLYLPIFNCFEAYNLNQNCQKLIENLELILLRKK